MVCRDMMLKLIRCRGFKEGTEDAVFTAFLTYLKSEVQNTYLEEISVFKSSIDVERL